MKSQEICTSQGNNLLIVFKVDKGIFCISGKYVSTIMLLPDYQAMTDAETYITGVFMHGDSAVGMYDLRSAFHIPTLKQEYENFSDMLDKRRQDHIDWVTELERTLETGEKFTLATDPHKCAFGKWYDQYPFCDNEASRHLKKIEEPHRRLHEAADEAGRCAKNCESCVREECLQKVLNRIKEEAMPQIIQLLDETKEIFRATIYHEMVLLLEGSKMGIVVDEVMDVEDLEDMGGQDALNIFHTSSLIVGVRKSAKRPELILELDLSALHEINKINE